MSATINRRDLDRAMFERLVEELHHPDPNRRIAAVRALADAAAGWGGEERARARAALAALLGDEGAETYTYGRFMCDEEERAARVCEEATRALARLG
jgi:hypothetical protein